MSATESPDVLIIGAGVIGCAIARALALGGAGRVVVVDRGQPGAEASGAAAGVLAVASGRAPRGALFELKRASARLYPRLVAELHAETGHEVGYVAGGLLDLAFTSREAEQLDHLIAKRAEDGFRVERLDGDAVRERYPQINPAVRRGAYFADDAAIDNGKLVAALHAAAEARGVRFLLGRRVRRLHALRERVTAVELDDARLTPGHVVIAAGAWSAALGAGLRARIPIGADRGEMMAVKLRPPLPPLPLPVSWRDGYLVPRPDGEVLIGSTSAPGVTDKQVTAGNAALLLTRAVRMLPGLADAPIVRVWSGLRPVCTLGRPIIGPLRGFANLTLAVGHHRNGILLAPITAQLIAELILHGATSLPLEPFKYRPR
ncbi:MAG: glycine oxidase ThiO [bacterium]